MLRPVVLWNFQDTRVKWWHVEGENWATLDFTEKFTQSFLDLSLHLCYDGSKWVENTCGCEKLEESFCVGWLFEKIIGKKEIARTNIIDNFIFSREEFIDGLTQKEN